MTRYEANKQIIELLTRIVEKYPMLRLGQILTEIPFYEESTTTLENLKDQLDWFDELTE